MAHKNRSHIALALANLFLVLGSALLAAPASAAAVDLSFTLKPGQGGCRQWTGDGQVYWNLTLIMNGTDTSSITTPTYVWIDDSTAPAMRADSWVPILTASGDVLSSTKSFDPGNGNTFVTGPSVYSPSQQGLDVWLYSGSHLPEPAPPTNISLILTPQRDSENKDHYFNISAQSHRQGTPTVTRRVTLCVHIPPKPLFAMGAKDASLQAAAQSSLTVQFWLKNTGNTQDYFTCNVTVPRDDWTWSFAGGMNYAGGVNYTNLMNLSQNLTVKVNVTVPSNARARENSTVSLNCTSYKAGLLGLNLFVYPPYTKVEVIQYFFVNGRIPSGTPSTLAGVPGDQLRFDFLVQNFGNGPDQGYARLVEGDFPSWQAWETLVTPSDFDMPWAGDPGSNQTAQFLVTIPLNTPVLTYQFTLNVTSTANVTPAPPITSLRFHVQVKQIYIPLVSSVPAQTGQNGKEVVFNFTIANGGNYLDSLTIQVFNLSDWKVFLSPPQGKKLLDSGASFTFQATVIVPRELLKAQVGLYNQTVRVGSEYAQLDLGLSVFVEVGLSVIILPQIACGLDPPETNTDLNPFAFPNNIATANYVVALSNLGNGGDAVTLTAKAPTGFNVTLEPSHHQLNITGTKAVLVKITAPAGLASGDYEINVTGRSDFRASAQCHAVYRLTSYHFDVAINPTIQSYVTNPQDTAADVPPLTASVVSQVEGYRVRFRVFIENHGDRAIPAGAATVIVYDDLACTRVPIGATNDSCGSNKVFNWSNPNNIITGTGGSVYFEFHYFAPEYLCFDEDICHRREPPPPANAHVLRFVVTMRNEADTTNNVATVTVEDLPDIILGPGTVAAQLPVVPIIFGAAIAGFVGFAYWYRFVRKPKVDEDLYASIYGGAQGRPSAAPVIAQAPTGTHHTFQGMTDEQLEEARRMYGDDYGR